MRNRGEYLRMFRDRMRSEIGAKGFLQDAMKGVKDIMRQQVSQGRIGDMSRVARISAMCFTRGKDGGTFVTSRRSMVLLPALRYIMVLCQAS